MKPVLVCSISVLGLVCAGSVAADPNNNNIKGDYGFTGTAACLSAPGHFDAPTPLPSSPTPGVPLPLAGFDPSTLRPIDPPDSYSHSFAVEGIRTFNGDGTGSVKGTAVGITVRPTPGPNGYPHSPPSAGSSDFSFSFTYTVDGKGGWTTAMAPGSYTETFITGPRTGQTVTVDAIPPVVGMISKDGKTLIAAHVMPIVEVHTFSNGDVEPMICHRSRVFISLN
jgi:hypothetical protein